MTRITASDQVLMLLREQLQRISRDRAGRAGRAGTAARADGAPVARLRALAGREGLNDEEFRRTFVRALLAEQLGERVALDPGFQSIADDVYRIVSEDEDARALIGRALEQLRVGASPG
jgi:hypothetical protein